MNTRTQEMLIRALAASIEDNEILFIRNQIKGTLQKTTPSRELQTLVRNMTTDRDYDLDAFFSKNKDKAPKAGKLIQQSGATKKKVELTMDDFKKKLNQEKDDLAADPEIELGVNPLKHMMERGTSWYKETFKNRKYLLGFINRHLKMMGEEEIPFYSETDYSWKDLVVETKSVLERFMLFESKGEEE